MNMFNFNKANEMYLTFDKAENGRDLLVIALNTGQQQSQADQMFNICNHMFAQYTHELTRSFDIFAEGKYLSRETLNSEREWLLDRALNNDDTLQIAQMIINTDDGSSFIASTEVFRNDPSFTKVIEEYADAFYNGFADAIDEQSFDEYLNTDTFNRVTNKLSHVGLLAYKAGVYEQFINKEANKL